MSGRSDTCDVYFVGGESANARFSSHLSCFQITCILHGSDSYIASLVLRTDSSCSTGVEHECSTAKATKMWHLQKFCITVGHCVVLYVGGKDDQTRLFLEHTTVLSYRGQPHDAVCFYFEIIIKSQFYNYVKGLSSSVGQIY
jgi:hypothetical protein